MGIRSEFCKKLVFYTRSLLNKLLRLHLVLTFVWPKMELGICVLVFSAHVPCQNTKARLTLKVQSAIQNKSSNNTNSKTRIKHDLHHFNKDFM